MLDNNSKYINTENFRPYDYLGEQNTETHLDMNNEFTSDKSYTDNQIEKPLVSVFDVALYILKQMKHPCSTMKLHKLLYYCQAWSLVWDEQPLFPQRIEAWVNGPVIKTLFNFHKGMYEISAQDLSIGNDCHLSQEQKDTINAVLDAYGEKTAQWLINQTHLEKPWNEARQGLEPDERGNNEITLSSMLEYYSSLI